MSTPAYKEIAGKEGICPECGGELEYGTGEITEDSYGYEVSCSCGFAGKEWYTLTFDCFSTED